MNLIFAVISEMRIKQWVKNLFVFAAPLFHGTLFESSHLLIASAAFIAFSFVSSSVYFFNDIFDREKDKSNPKKQNRPIAAGKISLKIAWGVFAALFILSMLISYFVNIQVLIWLFSYFAINILYTIKLKHIVIVDVFVIAYGFIVRAVSGAAAIHITLTTWFLLCVFFLSLFLALGKRRNELYDLKANKIKEARRVLKFYSIPLIDQLTTVVSACLIICYSLFVMDKSTQNNDMLPFTIPLVIYGLFYYLYIVRIKNEGGAPDELLYKAHPILAVVVLYVLSIVFIRNI